MAMPSSRFTVTPPTMMMRRCHAGLLRNSQGSGGLAICSLSMLSSTMPLIFT